MEVCTWDEQHKAEGSLLLSVAFAFFLSAPIPGDGAPNVSPYGDLLFMLALHRVGRGVAVFCEFKNSAT